MSLVIWNPAWETGIQLIDHQHQELLAQFEALLVAIHEDHSETRVPGLLVFLADYVETHFATEEAHMIQSDYPGLPEHKAIHDQMRSQVKALVAGVENNAGVMTEEVVNFLTEWLLRHINDEDRNMARHLRLAHDQGPGTRR